MKRRTCAMNVKSGLSLSLLLFVTSCSLIGCTQPVGKSSKSPVANLHLTPIRIGGAPAFELILPSLVAMNQGYFRQQGLEVSEFIQGPGSDMRTALLSGDLDIGLLAFVHVPLARLKGQDLKIVATVYEKEIFSLVVRTGLRGEVKTVADLRGKKIGIAKPGSGNWALVSSYLAKAGLDPEKDVEFIAVGNNLQTVYSAIKSDRIDAYPSFEPQTTILIEKGLAFPLISIWNEKEHDQWVGESAMSMVLAAKEERIDGDPLLIQKIVNAQKLAAIYIREHETSHIAKNLLGDTVTASKIGDIDEATLIAILERIKNGYSLGPLNQKAYEIEMRLYNSAGVLKNLVPFDEATDWRFSGLTP